MCPTLPGARMIMLRAGGVHKYEYEYEGRDYSEAAEVRAWVCSHKMER